MKKTAIILFHVLLIFTCTAGAQESKSHKSKYLIKYDLISLLGDQVTNSVGIQIGSEIFIKANQSLEVDAMVILPCASAGKPYVSVSTENTNGFMLSAGYRYYIHHEITSAQGFHIGPQLYYQYTKSKMFETYDGGIPNNYYVHRKLLALHAMTGYQLKVAGRLYFNPAVGLGIRYIFSNCEGKMGEDPGQYEYPYNKDFESGDEIFPSININIKIGIKL